MQSTPSQIRHFAQKKCAALRHTPFESAWFGLSKKAKMKKIHRGLFVPSPILWIGHIINSDFLLHKSKNFFIKHWSGGSYCIIKFQFWVNLVKKIFGTFGTFLEILLKLSKLWKQLSKTEILSYKGTLLNNFCLKENSLGTRKFELV